MKRGLVFSLCALAVAVSASSASAQAPTVSLSLNLRYTDPADPSEGGKWFLVAKTNDTDGIAAVNAYISNITAGTAGSSYGNGAGAGAGAYAATTAANLGAILNGGNPYKATIGGAENIVYGQDTANGPIIADVGQGVGTPGNTAVDPLRNPVWNNAAIIANGTFAGLRPAFVTAGANSTDANTLAGTTLNVAAQDAATTAVVRGDSVTVDGLKAGDANRSGTVDGDDFALLAFNFGLAAGATWDQGDFNDSGAIDGDDFALLAFNFGQTATPPSLGAVAAVPEPASAVLIGLAVGGLYMARRRS